jgi:ankyrin repeat protein
MSASNLISACQAGRLSEVISLVTNGQDVNMKDSNGYNTPLMWAIWCKHWDIVRWLLGVRTLVISQTSSYAGLTVLHWACAWGASSEIINMIVTMMDSKISNAKTRDGRTAIMVAVRNNNQPAVKYLGGLPGIVWDYQTLVSVARLVGYEC